MHWLGQIERMRICQSNVSSTSAFRSNDKERSQKERKKERERKEKQREQNLVDDGLNQWALGSPLSEACCGEERASNCSVELHVHIHCVLYGQWSWVALTVQNNEVETDRHILDTQFENQNSLPTTHPQFMTAEGQSSDSPL